MAIFNSYVKLPEGKCFPDSFKDGSCFPGAAGGDGSFPAGSWGMDDS